MRWKRPFRAAFLESLDLFQRKPELLQESVYVFNTDASPECFEHFMEALTEGETEITPEIADSFEGLCEEFGVHEFDDQIRAAKAESSSDSNPELHTDIAQLKQRLHSQEKTIEAQRHQIASLLDTQKGLCSQILQLSEIIDSCRESIDNLRSDYRNDIQKLEEKLSAASALEEEDDIFVLGDLLQ